MRARVGVAVAVLVGAFALLAWTAPAASAHVVPASSVQLSVGESSIRASVTIPASDLEAASGVDLADETRADLSRQSTAIRRYLTEHFAPTSDGGQAWSVIEGALRISTTGNPATTGRYRVVSTSFVLTPPAGGDLRSFDLGYDAVVDRVATHVVIVTTSGTSGTYEVGVVKRSTVTNAVEPLHVSLDSGSEYRGFASMVRLGMQHIEEGTDHQLFLLTLLLPAPLLATSLNRRRRWAGPVAPRHAVRRIAAITISFTLGHSVTLALGALGFPVAQGLVEAMIALSILVAAVHAVRPIFPGREALVAASFGLVHGLAFSEVLRSLDLSGTRLLLALLGFNLGIEAMQLIIVALVLPPLIVLARTPGYQRLRVTAALATAVAAVGWLAARLGLANPVADAADRLGLIGVPLVLALWLAALVLVVPRSRPGGAALSIRALPRA